jgi:hypothetical protein
MVARIGSTVSLAAGILILISATVHAATYSTGVQIGYVGAPGVQANFQVSEFAQGLPLDLSLGLEFAAREAGSPTDARRIFINDATNGVPQESGQVWNFRLDMAYRLPFQSHSRLYLYGGPRYGSFTSNFKFIGGNEDFDVTSQQWGWGLGLEGLFAISPRMDFLLGGGFDQYFEGELKGHDTAYDPGGESVNGRADYTYEDADAAINQPKFTGRLLLGISYRFGL